MNAKVSGTQHKEDKRRGGTRSMAQILPPLTRPILGKRGLAEANLLADWRTIVGEERAQVCRPDKLTFPRGRRNGGTLHLRVASGAAVELQHEAPRLIERINGYFGYAAVAQVRLLQVPFAAEAPERPVRDREAADPRALAAMRDRLAGIEDPELRATLDRLGAAVLAESPESAKK